MVAAGWGTFNLLDAPVASALGVTEDQPAIADSVGETYAIAWRSLDATGTSTIRVTFYNTVGEVDLLGSMTLSDTVGVVSAPAIAAAGDGYAVVWQESPVAGASADLHIRYVGTVGPIGGEIVLATAADDHDAAVAGFELFDAGGTLLSTGFNVAWIATAADTGDVRFGEVKFQRYELPPNPADPKGDPLAPVPAGIDGIADGSDAVASLTADGALGRNVAMAVTHDGEAMVAWIGSDDSVHLRVLDADGTDLTGSAINGAAAGFMDALGVVDTASDLEVVAINGTTDFVVAWTTTTDLTREIRYQVFTAGAVADTWDPVAAKSVPAPPSFNGEFGIAALDGDAGGFALTMGSVDANGTAGLVVQIVDAAGDPQGGVSVVNTTTAGAQSAGAVTGLLGDRFVTAFQDTSVDAAGDIRSRIMDTRAPGQTIVGDLGLTRARVDLLVGTISDDTIDGGAAADQLYGALGNDRLIGGVGSDVIDGDGGTGDVAVYTGRIADYSIAYNGDGSFTITDNRVLAPGQFGEGADLVRNVEFFEFAGVRVAAADFIPPAEDGTPTGWALDNSHLDGVLLTETSTVRAQGGVSLAENFGEFYGVAWRVNEGGTDHIRVQLFSSDGSADVFLPAPFNVDDGVGTILSDPTIGGWGDGYVVIWQERDGASDPIKLQMRFTGPEAIVGGEFTVAVSSDGYLGTPVISAYEIVEPDPVLAGEVQITSGFNVLWQQADGRIELQRYMVPLDALGNPSEPIASGIDGKSTGINLPVEVGTGRNPSMAVAHDGETIITWVDAAGLLQGRVYNANGSDNATQLVDIGTVADGFSQQVVPLGAGNFGIVWIESDPAAGGLVVKAQTYVLGAGPGVWVPGPVNIVVTHADLTLGAASNLTGEFKVAGLGEDNEGFLVVFGRYDGDGTGIFVQHVNGFGVPVGDLAAVNVETRGDQSQFGLGGLISDRFVVAYRDDGAAAGNVVTRIMDTRDPAGEQIFGDLVLPTGGLRARRDEIYGTTGDDMIDGRGNDDKLVGGLGNDTLVGGIGDDHLIGGSDLVNGTDLPSDPITDVDVAVYSDAKTRYSVSVNGDGSFTVKDMRPGARADEPGPDGTDVISQIEQLRFDGMAGTDVASSIFFQSLPGEVDFAGVAPWGLSSTKDFAVNTDPQGAADLSSGAQGAPSVASLENNFVITWTSADGGLYAKPFNSLGQPDALFGPGVGGNPAAQVFRLDDGAGAILDPFTTMAGDLGFVTVWEEAGAVRMRHVSALDGVVGIEAGVSAAAAGTVQHDAVAAGYEIVDINNDTLEFGYNAVWVESAAGSPEFGAIMLERFDVFSQVALDAGERAPQSIGLDGLVSETADNHSVMVAASGRDPNIASLHDGQQIIAYIDDADAVRIARYVPVTDLAREIDDDGNPATPTIVNPHYGISEFVGGPAFGPVGTVSAPTDQVQLISLGFNFAVVWADAGSLKARFYTANGTSWSPGAEVDLGVSIPAGSDFKAMPAGEADIAANATFLVAWESAVGTGANNILVQRFDAAGAKVGGALTVSGDGDTTVADAATGTLGGAGLLDGRLVVAYQGQADNAGADATDPDGIVARILETRTPGTVIIGPRDGAPRDLLVGTAGNDILDGRALEDELHGGLGNDVLLGGTEDDLLFGEDGNDSLLGGSEDDQLDGGAGDDLLLGGFGQDTIDGGAGSDTISYQGEFARFRIDLSAAAVGGVRQVLSDRNPDTGAGLAAFAAEDSYSGIENVTGGESDDTITGNGAANVLAGRAGNDVIDGNGDNDTIDGGAGNDTVTGGAGLDVISGGGGLDTLSGNAGNDNIDGGDDKDLIFGGAGDDSLSGGAGNDELRGDAGNDRIDGGAGDQDRAIFLGNFNAANFTIDATSVPGQVTVTDLRLNGDGVDILTGVEFLQFNNTTLSVAALGTNTPIAVDDEFSANEDTSIVIAPLDNDANANPNQVSIVQINGVNIAAGQTVTIPASPGAAGTVGTLTLAANDQLTFVPAADFNGDVRFTYTVARNSQLAQRDIGDVLIRVAAVNDAPFLTSALATTVSENTPNNTVFQTLTAADVEGSTPLTFSLVDSAEGRFKLVNGNQLAVAASPLIDFEASSAPLTVQVKVTDATGVSQIQTIAVSIGDVADTTASAPSLNGNNNANNLAGAGGDDRIFGNGGDDTLNGGSGGNDILNGGAGRDTMTGGTGNDTYVVDDSGDRVTENANEGYDTIETTLTSYSLGNNIENLIKSTASAINARGNGLDNVIAGNAGNDTLDGGAGNDLLVGNAGNDGLTGGDGDDQLFGGAGADTLTGGNGNDVLNGGGGNDVLNGGGGNDVFVFQPGFGADTIATGGFGDAAGNQDVIQLSAAQFATFADIQAVMTQSGANVVIDPAGTDVLTIQGVTIAQLGADDFLIF